MSEKITHFGGIGLSNSNTADPDVNGEFKYVSGTGFRFQQEGTVYGLQVGTYAATATADGLTTGLIPSGVSFVIATSAGANNIITLPTAVVGHIIHVYIGATGCEVRTPAASNATINTVDADGGAAELALTATSLTHFYCVAAGTWIAQGVDELGAYAALVPDAI